MRRRSALRGIGLFCALLLVALPIPFLADPIAYVPLLMVLFSIGFSYGALRVSARSFVVSSASIGGSCERGESVPIEVELNNRSLVPVSRMELRFFISDPFGGEDVESRITIALGSRERLPLLFDATFAHLGVYQCGISEVVLHDFFGLFSRTVYVTERSRVHVHPRLFDVNEPDLAHVVQEESANVFRPIASDDQDYAGVREYRFGDPMKTVHWNLSGRDPQGRLFTRLYEVQAEPSLVVIVDSYAPAYDHDELMGVFDALVESAASICEEARRQGVDAEVRFLDRDGVPRAMHLSGTVAADDLVGSLRPVSVAENSYEAAESAQMLEAETRAARGHGNVAYVSARADETAFESLVSLRMHRRNPLMFYALPRSLSGHERDEAKRPLARLAAANVPYYIVDSNEVATGVRAS